MSDNIEFEILAKLHGLDVTKGEHGYFCHRAEITRVFWDAQQAKIDKLEHDLGNERCANRMLQHVLDKEVKS